MINKNNQMVKNSFGLMMLLVLMAALIAGLTLMRVSQDTRKGAYIGSATASLLPSTASFQVGDDIPVVVILATGDKKVDQVDARVCVSDRTKVSMDSPVNSVIKEDASGFTEVVEPAWLTAAPNCVRAAFVNTNYDESVLKSGSVKVGTFRFKAVASGTVTFNISGTDRLGVAALNPNGLDHRLFIDSATDSVVTIVGSGTGTGPAVSFTMRFSGMQDFDANNLPSCLQNMKVDVTAVNSAGERKIYENVPVTKTATLNGTPVWTVNNLRLAGFTSAASGKDSLFIRGPKHIQTKFGVNNQSAYYNQALGQLSFVDGANFNFTGYPILAGDVVGNNSSSRDGDINGLDFSYVKTESLKGVSGNIKADLDYNCILNSNDLNILKSALNERQSQSY